jgi:hypothetical protein
MTTLTGKTISQTYKDLLQVSNSNSGVDATLRDVEDGEGTASALQVSTTAVNVNGNLDVTGTLPGVVLDYDKYESETGPTTTSVDIADMTDVTVSVVTAQDALVLLRMQLSTSHPETGKGGYVLITDGDNTAKSTLATHFLAGGEYQTCSCIGYDAVSAGTSTYKGRFYAITGGTFSTHQIHLEAIAFPR